MSEPQPNPVDRPSLAQAIADLVQMFVDYVRQETGDIVREKVVVPTQVAGQVVAFALAAAGVLLLGIGYLSVAAMMVLADFVGWPSALAIIGGVLVIGAAALTFAKMRRVQR
ncbi:MAG: hypothetical protein CVT67_03650 [Actinobacteria bacterium HGW-Actinobacteria-7]|jgi:hypothetical protein|nr:MAG: hypothetical protein CVT67_03650 [Actinobacteria bacterium HGW-Actinobacteria-7]